MLKNTAKKLLDAIKYIGGVIIFLVFITLVNTGYENSVEKIKSFKSSVIHSLFGKTDNDLKRAELEKNILPKNYRPNDGDFVFPQHKNIEYGYANDLCTYYALQQLKYDFPEISFSKYKPGGELSYLVNTINSICVGELMSNR